MTVKIIDASAFAAIAFQEREQTEMLARTEGHELHAPALLRFEIANVCLKKIRRQQPDRELLLSQHQASRSIVVEEHTINPPAVLELAERFNLSACDARYLWLARELDGELVTLDARLARAASEIQSSS